MEVELPVLPTLPARVLEGGGAEEAEVGAEPILGLGGGGGMVEGRPMVLVGRRGLVEGRSRVLEGRRGFVDGTSLGLGGRFVELDGWRGALPAILKA